MLNGSDQSSSLVVVPPYLAGLKVPTPQITRRAFQGRLRTGGPEVADWSQRCENRRISFAIPYVWVATPEQQTEGLDLVVARQSRRIAPTSVDPTMKNFHWGDFNRALFEANDRATQHVVLVNDEGAITEGPGFNVFALKDGVLHTPASGVLLGITRKTVIQLAEQQGTEVRIADFDESVLLDADEIFLTSTAGGVMPVTHIEKRPLGDGRPGPFATAIRKAYWDAHAFDEWSTAVDYPDNGT